MQTWYRVQVTYGDGHVYLSRAFRTQAEADTWARSWRRVKDAIEVRVLVRPGSRPAA